MLSCLSLSVFRLEVIIALTIARCFALPSSSSTVGPWRRLGASEPSGDRNQDDREQHGDQDGAETAQPVGEEKEHAEGTALGRRRFPEDQERQQKR